MNANDVVRLRDFGLGKFHSNPLRNYTRASDICWNLRFNEPCQLDDISARLVPPIHSGFFCRVRADDIFSLVVQNDHIWLAVFCQQHRGIYQLKPNIGYQIAGARRILYGRFCILAAHEVLFSYHYLINRIAEFFIDPMLDIDFFLYVNQQFKEGFSDFVKVFDSSRDGDATIRLEA